MSQKKAWIPSVLSAGQLREIIVLLFTKRKNDMILKTPNNQSLETLTVKTMFSTLCFQHVEKPP